MEKQIIELLNKLNIESSSIEEDGEYYVIKLDSYDEFIKTYNKLEKSLEVFKNSLLSFITDGDSHIQYETDSGILLELVAILDEDNYTLNISIAKDN